MIVLLRIAGVLRVYALLIAAVFSWMFMVPVACTAQRSPKIEVDKKLLDFGVIYRGDPSEGIFIISNKGDSTLRIDDVRTTCGCTAAILDEKVLEPDQQTKINAKFSSDRYKGKVSKNIFVRSNDPKNPITTLTVQAEVKVDLEVSPGMIYFSGLKAGDKVTRNIILKNLSDSTITIQEISSTIPAIKVDLSKMKIPPGEEVNLALVVEELKKDMSLSGYITVRNSSHQDKISVRIYGGKIK
jgi:Protein of unknown function (DUF1573)